MEIRSSSRYKAFTLVEILVVVAIILVLAALIFPVYVSARSRGRDTTCLANASQLSKAMLMYASDNSGQIATATYDDCFWLDQLSVYSITASAIRCPAYRGDESIYHNQGTGWAVNKCLANESLVRRSDNTVMFTETTVGRDYSQNGSTGYLRNIALASPDSMLYGKEAEAQGFKYDMIQPFGAKRHHGGSHYPFLDGHIKWLRTSQLRLPYNLSCAGGRATWRGPQDGPTFRTSGE